MTKIQEKKELKKIGQKLVKLSDIDDSQEQLDQLSNFKKTIKTHQIKQVAQTIKQTMTKIQEEKQLKKFGQKLVKLSDIDDSQEQLDQLSNFKKTIKTLQVKQVVQTIKQKFYCHNILKRIADLFEIEFPQQSSPYQNAQLVFDKIKELLQELNVICSQNEQLQQMMKNISFNSSSLSLQEKLIQLIQQVKTIEKFLKFATQAESDQCTSIKYDYATVGIQKYGTLLQQNIKREKQLRNKQMGEFNEFKKRYPEISLNFNDSLAENCSKLKKHYQMKIKITQSIYDSQLKDIDYFLKNIKKQDKEADKTQQICPISIEKKLKYLKEQLFLAEKAIKELQDERKANEKEKSSLQEKHSLQISQLKGSLAMLEEEKKRESIQMKMLLNKIREERLFEGQIFEGIPQEKLNLIQHVESYGGKGILKTKLLFNFDPLNTINFHKYVDGKGHILCVVKTANAIAAAYYPGALRKGADMSEGGLLVSVTNNESYQLRKRSNQNQKVYQGMIHESFFLVFGNFDIKIDQSHRIVSSKFGEKDFFFDSRGRKVGDLLGEGEKSTVGFENCQCYQLFFKEE